MGDGRLLQLSDLFVCCVEQQLAATTDRFTRLVVNDVSCLLRSSLLLLHG